MRREIKVTCQDGATYLVTLTAESLEFRGLIFVIPQGAAELVLNASAAGTFRLAFKATDTSSISILTSNETPPDRLTLKNLHEKYSSSLTFEQHWLLNEFAKEYNIPFSTDKEKTAARKRYLKLLGWNKVPLRSNRAGPERTLKEAGFTPEEIARLNIIRNQQDVEPAKMASLTRDGIKFRHLVFHDEIVTFQLLDALKPPGNVRGGNKVRVEFKHDANAGYIHVRNRAGKHPEWVLLKNFHRQYVSDGLTFAQHDLVHDFSQTNHLPFNTDDERLNAREKLQDTWDSISWLFRRQGARKALDALSESRRALCQSILPSWDEFTDADLPLVPDHGPVPRIDDTEPPSVVSLNMARMRKAMDARKRKNEEEAKSRK